MHILREGRGKLLGSGSLHHNRDVGECTAVERVTVAAHKQGRRQAYVGVERVTVTVCVGVERVTVTVMVAKGDRVSVATHNAAGLKTSEGSL